MFKVTVAIDVSTLVTAKVKTSFSASEKFGLKMITVSAASSSTVIKPIGESTTGQSFIGDMFIVTLTTVVVNPSESV